MTVETETFETEFFNTRALNYGCRVMRSGDPCRMIEAKGMGTMELTARGSSFDPIDSRQPVELALPPPHSGTTRDLHRRRPAPDRVADAMDRASCARRERQSRLLNLLPRRPAGPLSFRSFRGFLPGLPRAVTRLALAALLLAGAGTIAVPASADVLISNLGKTDGGTGFLNSYDLAQAFTTGSNTHGYTLTSVEVEFATVADPLQTLTVGIWSSDEEVDSNDDSDTHHEPHASLGTLTCPTLAASTNDAVYDCTTTGIDLAQATTYLFVVISGNPTLQINQLRYTASNDEDTGGATGWSIANNNVWRTRATTGTWTYDATESMKIRINGTAKAAPTPATLVKNTGQTAGTTLSLGSVTPRIANAFTTGSNAGGYTLTSVDLVLGSVGSSDDLTVTIRVDDSGDPGTVHATLTNPTLGNGTKTFTGAVKHDARYEHHLLGASPTGKRCDYHRKYGKRQRGFHASERVVDSQRWKGIRFFVME